MKKKLIICIILLFCIVISSVGCFEQYKFQQNAAAVLSDPNRVWIDDEHDIWFVVNKDNSEFYGQIVIDCNTYNFALGFWTHSDSIKFYIDFANNHRIQVLTSGKYYGDKLILTVYSGNPSIPIPDGTELVFKPYPRQAEHYLPK